MGTLTGTRGEVCRGAKFQVTYFLPLPLLVSELAGASLSLHLSPCRRSLRHRTRRLRIGQLGHPTLGWARQLVVVSAGFATDALIGWDGGGGAGGYLPI